MLGRFFFKVNLKCIFYKRSAFISVNLTFFPTATKYVQKSLKKVNEIIQKIHGKQIIFHVTFRASLRYTNREALLNSQFILLRCLSIF